MAANGGGWSPPAQSGPSGDEGLARWASPPGPAELPMTPETTGPDPGPPPAQPPAPAPTVLAAAPVVAAAWPSDAQADARAPAAAWGPADDGDAATAEHPVAQLFAQPSPQPFAQPFAPPVEAVAAYRPAVDLTPQFVAPPVAFAPGPAALPAALTAGRPARKRVGVLMLAAGLTLAVVAGTVAAVTLSRSGGGAMPAAVQEAEPSDAGTDAVAASEAPAGARAPAAPLPSSSVPPALIKPGTRLSAGQALRSPNGKYTLTQQPDGNLVLADDAKRTLWSAQTPANPGAYASFDSNGDLVVYAKAGSPLWRTATAGQGALLAVRDDGNVVLSGTAKQEVWSSQAERGRLYPGQALAAGQQRRTADGKFTLAQNPDGNLVVVGADQKVVWSSQTSGHQGASTLMQPDGNLVVYGTDKKPLWSSGTYGSTGAAAVLNADGNVTVTLGGKVLWATATDGVTKLTSGQRLIAGQSRTSPKGAYTLQLQPDGNLVLRNAANTVVWRSNTSGHPGASTRMQTDGNLVVYDAAGKSVWSTKTYGKDATYLLVQDDGTAVLYTAAKKAVWSTKTG